MLYLIIENVRCFTKKNVIPISPLTIITGENSSGKSTFLSALSVVTQPNFPVNANFNESPYDLGAYDTIATYKGGKYGRAKNFSIGYIEKTKENEVEVLSQFINKDGQARVSDVCIKNKAGNLSIGFEGPSNSIYKGELDIYKDGALLDNNIKSESLSLAFEGKLEDIHLKSDSEYFYYIIFDRIYRQLKEQKLKKYSENVVHSLMSIMDTPRNRIRSLSIAPIRTKPKRTYDQVTEKYDPEGNHVPFLLAKALRNKGSEEKEKIITALKKFGAESGMFRDIDVKNLGRNISDPFQIMVKCSGQPANLLDVGYGVSQSLPIIVESAVSDKRRLVLLQQPEVHLHPRAQAALGSFFSDLVANSRQRFVIETHSDYVVDRIRQEVAQGNLKANKVSILYFEKSSHDTNIHKLSLDKKGNILNAPPSYREFFLREELSLLKRTGH